MPDEIEDLYAEIERLRAENTELLLAVLMSSRTRSISAYIIERASAEIERLRTERDKLVAVLRGAAHG